MKIKSKISVYPTLTLLVLAIFVAVFVFLFTGRIIKEDKREYLLTVADSRAKHVDSFIESTKEKSRIISQKSKVLESLKHYYEEPNDQDISIISERIDEVITSIDDFMGGAILDQDRNIIVSVSDYSQSILAVSKEIYESGEQEILLIRDDNLGLPHLYVSSPLFLNEEYLGTIILISSLESLNDIVENTKNLGNSGEIYLINNDNYSLTPLRHISGSALDIKIETESSDLCRTHSRILLNENNNSNDFAESVIEISNYAEKTVLSTHSHINQKNWCLIAEVQRDEVFAPINQLWWIVGGSGFIMVIVFMIFSFISARLITKPLEKLKRGTEIIEAGDLSHIVSLDSDDEIGQLSKSFDRMTKSLKKSQQNIQKKVNIQTQKLLVQKKELKKSLKKVEEEKDISLLVSRKLEATLENIGEGVLVVNSDKVITIFNPTAESIIGISKSDALGKNYSEIFMISEESIKKNSETIVDKTFRTGKSIESTGKENIVQKNGNIEPIDYIAAPVKNSDNNVTGCVVVFRDVSKARSVDRTKSEFVSLASHQLRTPLSSIKWNVEMLFESSNELSKNNLKYLKRISKGSERMIQLVNALLNVSRLELGTFFIDPKDVNLKSIIKGVVDETEGMRTIKKLRLVVKHNMKAKKLKLDENLTRIIIQNLISNAIKYTPEKGKIMVITNQDKRYVHLTISDNGYGIPVQQQSMLFTKFHRADNVRELGIEGTGLGLYIIKFILDASGGKILFKSEEGKGSDFTVSFPIRGMKKRIGKKTLI
ncbi:cell wall metabolism sensor histidine kinase WalK [Patescibacteria group bacterium]|nr:cell wall metabolism sensor histidine kinase WalK [Patescibacteria group bacterium]MBU1952247.1 cell wall metabolism sensor histidine kinase WalK [Patescibacteria group bacterium]